MLIGNNEEANVSAWEYAVGTCKEKLAKAGAENSCVAKGAGGVVTTPSVRKSNDKKGNGGKLGPKSPQRRSLKPQRALDPHQVLRGAGFQRRCGSSEFGTLPTRCLRARKIVRLVCLA